MKIHQINQNIRDFVNDSIIKRTAIFSKKQDGYWEQFYVALDTIDDTCIAVENFQKDSGCCFVGNPYLETYGILQAFFIQQDAVNFLKIALFGESEEIIWRTSYPELATIRQLRNETIGHPTKKELNKKKSKYINNEVSYCIIDRMSLSKTGFDYLLIKYSKTEKKRVNFADIIILQDNNLYCELENILKKLQKEEMNHKLIFENKKLSDLLVTLLDKNLHYLIRGILWNDMLAWGIFENYPKQYKQIRDGLEKRYGDFEDSLKIQGTAEIIKRLDHIFYKIENMKSIKQFDKQDFIFELEIYLDALLVNLQVLGIHLQEIDDDFKI